MKILKRKDYWTRTHGSTVGSIFHFIKENAFWFNEEYQRPYVWGNLEQEQFLESLLEEKPVGAISIIEEMNGEADEYMEVVDGRQRITTLKMFLNNEISYNGYFWKDIDVVEQRLIKGLKLPILYLSMKNRAVDERVPMRVKLEYFYGVNFGGMPQSEEHRLKILKLLEN